MKHDAKTSELEIKLDATGVDQEKFTEWCKSHNPKDKLNVESPDIYYHHPVTDDVLRFRDDPKNPQLTLKLRKKEDSIKDRLEINVRLTQPTGNLKKLLKNIGYVQVLNLVKDSHIFWLEVGSGKESVITVVFYTVWEINENGNKTKKRQYIEVETESYESKTAAIAILSYWQKLIQKEFNITSEPIQESLYELYSGKRYKMVNDGN